MTQHSDPLGIWNMQGYNKLWDISSGGCSAIYLCMKSELTISAVDRSSVKLSNVIHTPGL